jgi:hypothetical protein
VVGAVDEVVLTTKYPVGADPGAVNVAVIDPPPASAVKLNVVGGEGVVHNGGVKRYIFLLPFEAEFKLVIVELEL